MLKSNKIYQGNAVDGMCELDRDSIDCIITSPPYWGLRDYGVEDQIGLEPTLEEYHLKLLEVTAECKRVLKKTGTMFWVHGDSYGGSGCGKGDCRTHNKSEPKLYRDKKNPGLKMPPKCLTMQNYRLAMRMVDEQGWILRNILIWHKKNHMPSSVQDRYTNAYEPVFFFSKNRRYHFDLDAIREPHTSLNNPPGNLYKERFEGDQYKRPSKNESFNAAGKNPGDVFTLPTQPFPEAHFAVFPEKLIEPFIKAGCPEDGLILDPFMGVGTTAAVAKKLGRNYIGIELNPEYIKIARKRLSTIPQRLDSYKDNYNML